MSKRNQKLKAKEPSSAEEREDTESDSSSLDKDLFTRLSERLDKQNEDLSQKLYRQNEDFRNEFKNDLMKMFQEVFKQAKE